MFQGCGLLFVNRQIHAEMCTFIDQRMIHSITHSVNNTNMLQSRLINFPTQRIRRLELIITDLNHHTIVDAIFDQAVSFLRTLTSLIELQVIWAGCNINDRPKLLHEFSRTLRVEAPKTLERYKLVPMVSSIQGQHPQSLSWIYEKRASGVWVLSGKWLWE